MTTFWSWLFKGSGNGAGLKRFLDRWILLHITVGLALAFLTPIPLKEAAVTLLLPVAGIFIGLSFAWGGNAQALPQSTEIENMSSFRDGGYVEYVYTFQAAILLILVTLVLWAIAGLGVFDMTWPTCSNRYVYFLISFFLFFFSSLTLRECWHVVLGAQSMLLARFQIRKSSNDR
jgi:hypothetical protein